MYVCGPTVYNYCHIGNFRPPVVFDVLARVLRAKYPKVTYARNITDIDDKINAAAAEQGEASRRRGAGPRRGAPADSPSRGSHPKAPARVLEGRHRAPPHHADAGPAGPGRGSGGGGRGTRSSPSFHATLSRLSPRAGFRPQSPPALLAGGPQRGAAQRGAAQRGSARMSRLVSPPSGRTNSTGAVMPEPG